MNRGVIGGLEKETGCFHRVTWRIPKFMPLLEEKRTHYSSPHFYFLNSHWFLRIYPNDKRKGSEWIGIYVVRSSRGPPQSVDCIFSIRKADGMEEHFYNFMKKHIFSLEKPVWGTRLKFLQRSKLLKRKSLLAPSDALTIVCTLSSNVEVNSLISSKTQTDLPKTVANGEESKPLVSGEMQRDLPKNDSKEDERTQLELGEKDSQRKRNRWIRVTKAFQSFASRRSRSRRDPQREGERVQGP